MDVNQPVQLLGGLSPAQFMRRCWQKKPLMIRGAFPHFDPALDRSALFALAAQEEVESRLVMRPDRESRGGWKTRQGPFSHRALPSRKRAGWTLLVQGVDLHVEAVHALLNQFRFAPDARLDDLMVSYASDGGGVGPHFDSYDVFLLQAQGRRRWRIGRQKDLSLRPDTSLKILQNFEPDQEFELDPGDMLYLPPRWAHDGIALGECMTYSVGFQSPMRGDIGAELLQRLAQDAAERADSVLYRDSGQSAVDAPGAIPAGFLEFARRSVQHALRDPVALQRVLGEYLTEPKPRVWFEAQDNGGNLHGAVRLDRKTRMMYDQRHVFINGETYRAGGRDAALMRRLSDARVLDAGAVSSASDAVHAMLRAWSEAGWVHGN